MYSPSILFVLLVALLQRSHQTPLAELKSVVVLFRHGDRAPVSTFPNDPYRESTWPYGFGELTNIGKNQHYALGHWFRNRYSDFLSREYSHTDIQVQASNVNRCLMSAESNLAGLYQPVDWQIWNKSLPWQPIPAHTTPETDDALLAQGRPCPKYDNLYNDLLTTKPFQKVLQKNKEYFEFLSEKTGENITTLSDFYILRDTLYIESLYNLTLAKWAQELLAEGNERVNELVVAFWDSDTYTTELARLKSGPLIDLITSQLENVTYSTGTPKFLMLSGHDSTVANLLHALKIFDNKSPPYASTVILELRQAKESHYVNIFYKKFDVVTKLTLPGCDFNCDLNRFRQIVQPVRISVSDWVKACQ